MNCNRTTTAKLMRATILLLVVLTMLPLTLSLEVTTPTSVAEGEAVMVSLEGEGLLKIIRDNQVVQTGTGTISYSSQTSYDDSGLVNFEFTSDDENEVNETRVISIVNTPLSLTILEPAQTEITTSQTTFSVETNWPAEFCWVHIDQNTKSLSPQGNNKYSTTTTVAEGVHTVEYECSLDGEADSQTTTVLVDAASPTITESGPTGIVIGPYITIFAETDEIVTCRYGTTDAPFDSLENSMGSTFARRSETTLNLPTHGPTTYFVRCKDVYGHSMSQSEIISFTNQVAPAVEIDIKDAVEPLTAGRYQIIVTPNMELKETPTIQYEFQGQTNKREVGVTKEGTVWIGYITLPDDLESSAISFFFEGVSLQNVAGNQITAGNLFEIDTQGPGNIDGLSVERTQRGAELTWTLLNEEEDTTYNIYKSTSEGITYANLYKERVKATTYVDKDVHEARYYYYRIAAVDSANNVGGLSSEAQVIGLDKEIVPTVIEPLLQFRLENQEIDLEAFIIDIDKTIQDLETESNALYAKTIKELGLVNDAKEARLLVVELLEEIDLLKAENPSEEEVSSIETRIAETVSKARKQLIVRISVENEISSSQLVDLQSLEEHTPYVFVGQELAAKEKDSYLQQAVQLQERLSVGIEAMSVTLWSKSGRSTDKTIIKKSITLDSPANDITVIEVIPKEVAKSARDITFSKQPVILEDDPIVQYVHPILERDTYTYIVDGHVSLEDVRESRTLVYPKVSDLFSQPDGPSGSDQLLTGNVIAEKGSGSVQYLLIVLGILAIVGLGTYYVRLDKQEDVPFTGIPNVWMGQQSMSPAMQTTSAQQVPLRKLVKRRIVPKKPAKIIKESFIDEDLTILQTPEEIIKKMSEAEQKINNKEYEVSISLYKEVLGVMEEDEYVKQMSADKAQEVYVKLLLYKKLDQACQAAERKDTEVLESTLQEVKKLANNVGEEETIFMRDAKKTYSSLAQTVNRLKIDEITKY